MEASSVAPKKLVPKGPETWLENAGAAKKRLMAFTASRMVKMSNSVVRYLGSMSGLSNGFVEAILIDPPVRNGICESFMSA